MTIKEKLLVVRSGLGSSRRKTILAGGVALALATAGLGYAVLSADENSGSGAAKGELVNGVVQDGSGRTVLYWHDPMLPMERYNAPGKSSMGMDLQPKYADEGSGSAIQVSSQVRQNLGVRTA